MPGAPTAFGGLLVAVLILAPEPMTALRAALANALQRSINVALGSVHLLLFLAYLMLTVEK